MVAVVGLTTFIVVYLFIADQQSQGQSAAALTMPARGMQNTDTYWAYPVVQASGLVAMTAAYVSVALGLSEPARSFPWIGKQGSKIRQLHRHVAVLVITLVMVHAAATAFDAIGDSWRTVLWFNGWESQEAGSPANLGYNIGILAFYALLLLGPTYYLRHQLRPLPWAFLHRFILVFYVLSLWHALILGRDLGHYGWIRPVTWLLQIPLLWLVARRFAKRASANRAIGQPNARHVLSVGMVFLSYAAMAACLVIVLTGNSSFIETT